jgi:hypothetical protein
MKAELGVESERLGRGSYIALKAGEFWRGWVELGWCYAIFWDGGCRFLCLLWLWNGVGSFGRCLDGWMVDRGKGMGVGGGFVSFVVGGGLDVGGDGGDGLGGVGVFWVFGRWEGMD